MILRFSHKYLSTIKYANVFEIVVAVADIVAPVIEFSSFSFLINNYVAFEKIAPVGDKKSFFA